MSLDHDRQDVIRKVINDRISEDEVDQTIIHGQCASLSLGCWKTTLQQDSGEKEDQAVNNHRVSGVKKLHKNTYLKGGCKSKKSTDDRQSKNKSRDKEANHPRLATNLYDHPSCDSSSLATKRSKDGLRLKNVEISSCEGSPVGTKIKASRN